MNNLPGFVIKDFYFPTKKFPPIDIFHFQGSNALVLVIVKHKMERTSVLLVLHYDFQLMWKFWLKIRMTNLEYHRHSFSFIINILKCSSPSYWKRNNIILIIFWTSFNSICMYKMYILCVPRWDVPTIMFKMVWKERQDEWINDLEYNIRQL